MSEEKNKSEVARIREEIDAQNEAAKQGMYGLAEGVSKHAFITAKMDRIGELHDDLIQLVGEEKAAEIIIEVITKDDKKKP